MPHRSSAWANSAEPVLSKTEMSAARRVAAESSGNRHLRLRRELCGNDRADSGFFGRYAVQTIRTLHRLLIVRDDEHLRLSGKIAHHLAETLDVRIVEGGVHLVEQIERSRLDLENPKNQSRSGHGALAARERGQRHLLLARRLYRDLNTGLRKVGGLRLPHFGLTARKKPSIHCRERGGDTLEGSIELRLTLTFDLLDRLEQRRARLREILELHAQEPLAVRDVIALGLRVEVHVRLQTREVVAQPGKLFDDCIRFVAISALHVGAFFIRGWVLRKLRDQHSQFGFDLGQSRAVTLAAGARVALFLFGKPQLRFDASLPRYELLARFARLIEPRVERNNSTPQPLEMKVRSAGFFH